MTFTKNSLVSRFTKTCAFVFILMASLGASPSIASAQPNSNALTVNELKQRFELRADVYTLDSSGKKIVFGPNSSSVYRMNAETGRSQGDSSSVFNGNKVFIRWEVKIQDDGTIHFWIEEFKNGGDKYSESLGKKELVLENFEPIVWKPKQKNPENLVVRFIPVLREASKALAMEGLPVSGSNVLITDSAGYLWADEVGFSARFAGFKTHRGALVISYAPFKGSKELGIAEGKKMELKVAKNLKIKILSQTDFLPSGVTAKVYGTYDPTAKSKGANSVHAFDSNSEDRISKGFRN